MNYCYYYNQLLTIRYELLLIINNIYYLLFILFFSVFGKQSAVSFYSQMVIIYYHKLLTIRYELLLNINNSIIYYLFYLFPSSENRTPSIFILDGLSYIINHY